MNTVPLMGKFESFGDAASSLPSVSILIELTNLGSRAMKYGYLDNNKVTMTLFKHFIWEFNNKVGYSFIFNRASAAIK